MSSFNRERMHLPRIPHFFDQKNHINSQYRMKFEWQYIGAEKKEAKTQTHRRENCHSNWAHAHSHTLLWLLLSFVSLYFICLKLWKLQAAHTHTRPKLSVASQWIYSNLNTHSFYIASRCKVWHYAFRVYVLLPYTIQLCVHFMHGNSLVVISIYGRFLLKEMRCENNRKPAVKNRDTGLAWLGFAWLMALQTSNNVKWAGKKEQNFALSAAAAVGKIYEQQR